MKTLAERREEKQKQKERRALSANSKAAQRFKAVKAVHITRVRENQIGFTLEWSDKDPLGDGDESELKPSTTNRNPEVRNCAAEVWADEKLRHWVSTSVFWWKVHVNVVFETPNNKTNSHKIDEWILKSKTFLRDPIYGEDTELNKEILNKITASILSNSFYRDGNKNKGEFVRVDYRIVCVGV